MKRALIFGLSILMTLTFTAVSMAATVTVGGEFDFGKEWHATGEKRNYLGSESNVSNAKVAFTVQITDDTKAFAALKGDSGAGVNVDETWVEFTADYGAVKIGYFPYKQDQKDIIDDVIPDLKSGLTVSYAVKLTDQLTLNLAAANDDTSEIGSIPWKISRITIANGLSYSVGLAYDTDNFGVNANYFKYPGFSRVIFPIPLPPYSNDQFTAFSIMGYIKLDDLKLFSQYENNNGWWALRSAVGNNLIFNGFGVQNFIMGAVYDSADVPLFVRAEFDLNDQHTGTNEWALRLAYKMTGNIKLQYTVMRHNLYYGDFTPRLTVDNYITNELLLITTF